MTSALSCLKTEISSKSKILKIRELQMLHSDGDEVTTLRDYVSTEVITLAGIFFNADITPYAKKRDSSLIRGFPGLVTCPTGDYSLLDPATQPQFYVKFTPFFKRYRDTVIDNIQDQDRDPINTNNSVLLSILRDIGDGKFTDYDVDRNAFSTDNTTTHLGPFIKFGLVSIRQVMSLVVKTYGRDHGLVRQLFWRSFYDQVAYKYPRVLNGQVGQGGNMNLNVKYDAMPWITRQTSKRFLAWCDGRTGFPLIDAAMTQLANEGRLHNRLRMIVSTFLVKNLNVHWKLGELHFARYLIDYDPANNNGGWQWSSGSGADSAPYYRYFSLEIQSKKYDPDHEYVRSYLHHTHTIKEIVDAKAELAKSLEMYKQL
jgi:deoxyribodipyrimidine photo-lyase